eukprot:s290_g13.t1
MLSFHFRVFALSICEAMSATLDSEAAFIERAKLIGLEQCVIDKIKSKRFATFGRLAFGISYSPQSTDETPLRVFFSDLLDEAPSPYNMACLRRLFFESNAMALTDVRVRVESNPDPSAATRKLPTAERVSRQLEQEKRLGGLVFNPNTIPSNNLVDMFVEMMELGVLSYVKPESCCSRAQEVESVRKDPAVSTDAAGLLKLGTRNSDPSCETNTELKLRAAWQRRNLAMDLSGLVSFDVIEAWTQFLFTQLMRDQPKGFSKITLQQVLDCDKQFFIQASHMTMGKLAALPGGEKPLDETFEKLRESNEVLQYLIPLPASRVHEPSPAATPRPNKTAKTETPAKGGGKGKTAGAGGPSKVQIPDGCVTHDDQGKPLCFAYQTGKCKFKGPAGKRCARGTPFFVELFAGRGSLSRAMSEAGFSVLSIDHESSGAVVPIVALDLTSDGGQQILWDVLQSPNLLGIHMGLPCGTANRAREKPVSQQLQAQGAPNPPPLRSAVYPLGLPGLSDYHRAKVQSANALYKLAVEIILFCVQRNVVISVENPANSWLWAALVLLTVQHSTAAASAYNQLEKVTFHACCHGSTRRKSTGWLSTPGVYSALSATCQNDHDHEPWGVRWSGETWIFDTAAEAAYPVLLSQRAAACLVAVARARNFSLTPPLRLHDMATAAQGKQSRRHPPLIPEFHHFIKHPLTAEQPPGTKQLAPHRGGDFREEQFDSADGTVGSDMFCKLGAYHTPKQFLSLAWKVGHPVDTTEHLEEATRLALDANLKYTPELIKLERKKNLLQAKLLAIQLDEKERALHGDLPESLAKVLDGKRLLLWKHLLEKYQYDDLGVFHFMHEGVKLVGMHDKPPCYPERIKPAVLSQQDLENSALWRRKAIIGKRSSTQDPEHVAHLEETTQEELELGFLEGPFDSEDAVSAYFGHSNWMVVRRFVLVQGAEMKLRPIDDCLEAQLNKGYTSNAYLKLQDVDYVASMALKIALRHRSPRVFVPSPQWLGKCLDLSKAYKQMGIHPDHRHLAVIFFHGSDGLPKFFVANSLMFGATAAVYSFNRVSRSLWYLLNRMLLIPCGVFYDDFPFFSPAELAGDADASASALLDLLGWKHARTGPKGLPFAAKFQVLCCSLDLTGVSSGELVLENKPGRLDRLQQQLLRMKNAGKLTLHEGQVLHGLLRYACGFFSGRHLFQVCAEIMNLVSGSTGGRMTNVADFCDYAVDMLNQSKPRKLSAFGERRPFLIFTTGHGKAMLQGLVQWSLTAHQMRSGSLQAESPMT